MDLTSVFQEQVKGKRKINQQVSATREEDGEQKTDKKAKSTHILPSSSNENTFLKGAKAVLKSVENLHSFLLQHRKDYINTHRFLPSQAASMSDKERDQIDAEAKDLMKQCHQQIQILERTISELRKHDKQNQNNLAHLSGITAHLYYRLQLATETYSEQKSIRLKQIEESKNGYLKLPRRTGLTISIPPTKASKRKNAPTVSSPISTENEVSIEEEFHLGEVERRMLEEENLMLAKELECTVDQSRQVEEKMMEISNLLHTFSSKVAEQSEEIDNINQSAVDAKGYVDQGTREIRKAAEWSVDFRVFVLLFLLVASFALLFLDWIS